MPDCSPCRVLHEQGGIVTDMVGEYNPNKRDPSATMMRIATLDWETEKLDEGCRMLDEGIGLKQAARRVRSVHCLLLRPRPSALIVDMCARSPLTARAACIERRSCAQAGVLAGDLKEYWQTHGAEARDDDDDDDYEY